MTSLALIEDEAELRESLALTLRFEGYLVHQADTGSAGIALIRRHQPDLILCDIQLPGMDGFEILAAVRADPQLAHTPFIFLTARGEKPDVRLGMTSGADDYLVKPVPAEDLLAAIESRLKRFVRHRSSGADFSSAEPLESLGLTPKQAEVLLWVAQGKSNAEVAVILEITEATVKKHIEHIFAKLRVEKRGAASLIAIEALGR
jgi:DNA-binding NarL/FixJ family response regulator